MATAYKHFLASPNSQLLADNATLHYVTTTTTISGAANILKHLKSQAIEVKKKKQDIIVAIEGNGVVAVEVDTLLEFLTDGSAYLPGMDDNFLADRTVSLSIMHVVTFNSDGQIVQIRQTWDQGALLKQLDVVGKTGRNWPLRDSREQLSMINSCVKLAEKFTTGASNNGNDRRDMPPRMLRDPHASLSLFGPRGHQDRNAEPVVSPYAGTRPHQRSFNDLVSQENEVVPPVVSPYGGKRPEQRSFTDVIGDQGPAEPVSPSSGRQRSESKTIPPKTGSGKNFQPSRLFAESANDNEYSRTPEEEKPNDRFYRPDPSKYQHFEFADGSDPQDTPKASSSGAHRPTKSKHDSTWSFDDFNTPQKVHPTRGAFRAHESRDQDDNSSQYRSRGGSQSSNSRNYYDDDDDQALGNITNLKIRGAQDNDQTSWNENRGITIAGNGMGSRKAENSDNTRSNNQGINIAGNGMGSRKGADSAGAADRGINIAGDGMGGKKGTDRSWMFGG